MTIKSTRPHLGRALACLATIPLLYGAPGMADEAPTVAVRTQAPQYGVIAQPVQAYGVVGAAPGAVSSITLRYAAKIVQLRVQSGQPVARGATLFVAQADPAAVAAAKQAATALKLARDDLARTQALYAQSLATQSQRDAARKAALDARAAFDAQQALDMGNGRMAVTAPADGVVTQIAVTQGDQVQAGGLILQLAVRAASAQAMPDVTLAVDPAAAARIHPGDPVAVSGLSPASDQAAVQGKVEIVGAAVDPQSQLVNIGVAAPVDGSLLPGLRVKGEIATQAGRHWIVPRSALLRDGRGAYVYQIGKDRRARRVDVRERIENGAAYGVDGALDAALPLVVTGNYELHDGAAVHAQAAGPAGDDKEAGQ